MEAAMEGRRGDLWKMTVAAVLTLLVAFFVVVFTKPTAKQTASLFPIEKTVPKIVPDQPR